MRPKLFHDLSRHLAIRLEGGIRTDLRREPGLPHEPGHSAHLAPAAAPIPVYLCHPLDILEGRDSLTTTRGGEPGSAAAGVLYLTRIAPDARYRSSGFCGDTTLVSAAEPRTGGARWRPRGLWVRLRYVFLVVRATLEDELGALEAALRTLSDEPFVDTSELVAARADPDAGGGEPESCELPIEVVEEPHAWRDLGLDEHRLSICFDVAVPVASGRSESWPTIVDRDVRLEPLPCAVSGDEESRDATPAGRSAGAGKSESGAADSNGADETGGDR